MKQRLCSSLLLLMIALTSVAQEQARLAPPRRVSSEYIALGYCGGDIQYSMPLSNGAPTKAAIAITRSMLGAYKNAQIVGVRVGLSANATNVSGWIIDSGDFAASPAETSPTYAYKDQGWQDLIFRTPYEFSPTQGDNTTLIVGYTSTGENQVGFDGESETNDYANFMWSGSHGWVSMANSCRKNGYGNSCIQILLGGVDIPTADMAITSLITRHAEQGKPVTLRGIVINKVPTPVTSYTLACRVNDGAPIEKRITQNINANAAAQFEIELPAFTTAGQQNITVAITSVNDETDVEPGDNTLRGTIESVEAGCYFPQVHVVEESTNLSCGWCPRGMVVMESMEERHPGRFIGIAAHSDVTAPNDPLYVPAYYNELGFLLADEATMSISEPSGIMNRNIALKGDPLFWDGFFDAHEWDLSEAGLWLSSVSEVKNKAIDIDLTARFRHDHNSHPYRVAFILTEDKVSGYRQSNYYADNAAGAMGGWESLSNPCRVDLNHIARGIWQHGTLSNALPASLLSGKDYTVSYTMSLADTDYQSAQNLSVVALLIDDTTKQIIQAHRMPVGSSIEGVETPNPLKGGLLDAVYDLEGKTPGLIGKTPNPLKGGLLIQDGRKVLCR